MNTHVMRTHGDAAHGECIFCGGVWVKNTDLNPYNRKPNWKTWQTDTDEYWTPGCSGSKEFHSSVCNCKKCLEKNL